MGTHDVTHAVGNSTNEQLTAERAQRMNKMFLFGPNIKKMKERRNIEGLITALKNKKPEVRIEAIKALSDLKHTKGLIKALKNDSPNERVEAILALENIKAPEAEEALIDVLITETLKSVWQIAFEALSKLGVDWGIWAQKGETLFNLGRPDEAIACYRQAAEINPRDAASGMWGILMTLGRSEEAISWLDKTLDLDPKNNDLWCAKGICLSGLNKMEEALLCFDKALEIKPKDGEASYLKSIVLTFLNRDKNEIKTCFIKAIECDPKYVIEQTNEVGLPEGFPLSAQEWLEEITQVNEEVGVRLAHTYYDLCISDPYSGLETVESLLRKNPKLASNLTVNFARAMAYMAKGFQELGKRMETGEINLPVAEPEEIRLYLNDEQLNYLELALSEIRKIEDLHPELIGRTNRTGGKLDAIGYALESCIPGRVQATLGKTKLKYFGTGRIKKWSSVDEKRSKPFFNIFFNFRSIVRSALILKQDVDAKGREYIECMLFRRTFDVLGSNDSLGEAGLEDTIYLFDDGTFSNSARAHAQKLFG